MSFPRLLGRKVDLNTREDLSRYFRDEIARTAELIYEAEDGPCSLISYVCCTCGMQHARRLSSSRRIVAGPIWIRMRC